MQENHFRSRLERVRCRFNETFGMNSLINPKIRISVVFAIIKLGLVERKISAGFDENHIREFTRIANIIETIFAKIDYLNNGQTRI